VFVTPVEVLCTSCFFALSFSTFPCMPRLTSGGRERFFKRRLPEPLLSKLRDLDECFGLGGDSSCSFGYTVAWVGR
jgi:hypothetical protein